MSNFFISGIINIETTVGINEFPIYYSPIEYRFNHNNGVSSSVSGVGYNVSKALSTLGDDVYLHSIIGSDISKYAIKELLRQNNINYDGVLEILNETPKSLVLFDSKGTRKIILDLKDAQETIYPLDRANLKKYDCAILTNINFSRYFFEYFKFNHIKIATDVHVQNNVYDDYNRDFMSYADILFASNENIQGREDEFIWQLVSNYNNEIIVIGMGAKGCKIYERETGKVTFIPAVNIRPVVNTVGAGDALFSAFVHFYIKGFSAIEAIELATYFASYKIGEYGGSSGFISEKELLSIQVK